MSYAIIDEPKATGWGNFILNPILILFLSILIPLFWQPPVFGRYWMPLVWMLANGFFLGSSSLKKETLICIAGGVMQLVLFIGLVFYTTLESPPFSTSDMVPYIRIACNGILFLTLYFSAFTQMASYDLYEYLKEKQ